MRASPWIFRKSDQEEGRTPPVGGWFEQVWRQQGHRWGEEGAETLEFA